MPDLWDLFPGAKAAIGLAGFLMTPKMIEKLAAKIARKHGLTPKVALGHAKRMADNVHPGAANAAKRFPEEVSPYGGPPRDPSAPQGAKSEQLVRPEPRYGVEPAGYVDKTSKGPLAPSKGGRSIPGSTSTKGDRIAVVKEKMRSGRTQGSPTKKLDEKIETTDLTDKTGAAKDPTPSYGTSKLSGQMPEYKYKYNKPKAGLSTDAGKPGTKQLDKEGHVVAGGLADDSKQYTKEMTKPGFTGMTSRKTNDLGIGGGRLSTETFDTPGKKAHVAEFDKEGRVVAGSIVEPETVTKKTKSGKSYQVEKNYAKNTQWPKWLHVKDPRFAGLNKAEAKKVLYKALKSGDLNDDQVAQFYKAIKKKGGDPSKWNGDNVYGAIGDMVKPAIKGRKVKKPGKVSVQGKMGDSELGKAMEPKLYRPDKPEHNPYVQPEAGAVVPEQHPGKANFEENWRRFEGSDLEMGELPVPPEGMRGAPPVEGSFGEMRGAGKGRINPYDQNTFYDNPMFEDEMLQPGTFDLPLDRAAPGAHPFTPVAPEPPPIRQMSQADMDMMYAGGGPENMSRPRTGNPYDDEIPFSDTAVYGDDPIQLPPPSPRQWPTQPYGQDYNPYWEYNDY